MYFLLGVTISLTSLKGPDSLRCFWSQPRFRREQSGSWGSVWASLWIQHVLFYCICDNRVCVFPLSHFAPLLDRRGRRRGWGELQKEKMVNQTRWEGRQVPKSKDKSFSFGGELGSPSLVWLMICAHWVQGSRLCSPLPFLGHFLYNSRFCCSVNDQICIDVWHKVLDQIF